MDMAMQMLRRLCTTALILLAAADMVNGIELQGHRGARGLMPENTLPGFARALSIGVDVLEVDAAVTADGVVVASHNPQLNPALTRGPDGRWLNGHGPRISELTFAELKRFDVGRMDPTSSYAKQYPAQTPVDGTAIPTLLEIIALTERAGNDTVRFNVEVKARPDEPSLSIDPEAFADRVVETVRAAGVAERTVVQSFYWRVLERVRSIAPEITTACLSSERDWLNNIARNTAGPSPWTGRKVSAHNGSVPRLVKASGCGIWSPNYGEVNAALIEEAQALGLKVIVWTVNATESMNALIELGVDGIITDYPDRLKGVLENHGLPVPRGTPVTP
jgi:glycerophosphoryl diester phosphodiesterase